MRGRRGGREHLALLLAGRVEGEVDGLALLLGLGLVEVHGAPHRLLDVQVYVGGRAQRDAAQFVDVVACE